MGLVRATNPIATALIRRLGDGAGALTRDVTAEIDNLINWVKFAPRRIKVDTSVVGNVGAGLDDTGANYPAIVQCGTGEQYDTYQRDTWGLCNPARGDYVWRELFCRIAFQRHWRADSERGDNDGSQRAGRGERRR